MDVRERIELANARAAEVLTKGRPTWVDVRPAGEVIPGMNPDTILIAGPPIAVENIPAPVRTAICGALVHERRAPDLDSAWKLVLSGKIKVDAAQDYNAACGAAMATSASMPVCVVEDKVYGGRGFCALHPGNKQNVLRWGYYNDAIETDLVWFRDHYGLALGAVVRQMGGIDLINVMSKTAGMGDENHNRQPAASMYMALQMIQTMMDMDFEYRDRIVKEFAANDRFFLHVMMAGAESVLATVKEISDCTVMVAMGGNGVEFGMRFAGTGKQWFTVPAPLIKGLFLKPTYTDDDLLGFLGDSCVTEVYGLGGMSASAGPGYVVLTGSTFEDSLQRAADARQVCVAEHMFAPIPWDGGKGFPVGVDMRKVIGLNILPTSHGGGTLKSGGQGTMGSAKLPMDCFKQGLLAFNKIITEEAK